MVKEDFTFGTLHYNVNHSNSIITIGIGLSGDFEYLNRLAFMSHSKLGGDCSTTQLGGSSSIGLLRTDKEILHIQLSTHF